jgi:hypothetical protein
MAARSQLGVSVALAVLVAAAVPARGQPAPDDPGPEPQTPEAPAPDDPADDTVAPTADPTPRRRGDLPPTDAADVAGAPQPGSSAVSGVTRQAENPGGDRLLWIPRALLFVPRWTFWIAVQPIRGAAWAYERYQLRERFKRIFFNDSETLGLYPVAFFETGFGLNVGARYIMRDLFDEGESVKLRASYGGRYTQIYSLKASTGDRFPVEVGLHGELHIRNKDQFYGIGNGDRVDPVAGMTPIDPLRDDTAVFARFRQVVSWTELITKIDVRGPFRLGLTGGFLHRSFDDTDSLSGGAGQITELYQQSSLIGFDSGLSAGFAEIEAVVDTRRQATRYLPKVAYSSGWLLAGYAGYNLGFGADEASYARYGVDLQRYVNLFRGNRVLWFRLFAETVTGKVDEIPFVDLPRLGGALHLRGYPQDRFRDRAMALTSVEYQYDLHDQAAAFLFVDAGRVYRTFKDFELADLRVGYGAGVQVQTRLSFLARAHIASSTDGGLFLNLSFDPVYDARTRIRK